MPSVRHESETGKIHEASEKGLLRAFQEFCLPSGGSESDADKRISGEVLRKRHCNLMAELFSLEQVPDARHGLLDFV